MKQKISGLAIGILLTGSLLTGCDHKEPPVIKFVDAEQVMKDSGLAEQQQARLKAVDAKLQEGLKMAQENGAKLPEDKRAAALLADRQLLNIEWQRERRQIDGVALLAIKEAADGYRQEHKLSAILPAQAAFSFAPDADISKEIAQRLKDKKLDFGTLPEIGVKTPEQSSSDDKPAR